MGNVQLQWGQSHSFSWFFQPLVNFSAVASLIAARPRMIPKSVRSIHLDPVISVLSADGFQLPIPQHPRSSTLGNLTDDPAARSATLPDASSSDNICLHQSQDSAKTAFPKAPSIQVAAAIIFQHPRHSAQVHAPAHHRQPPSTAMPAPPFAN